MDSDFEDDDFIRDTILEKNEFLKKMKEQKYEIPKEVKLLAGIDNSKLIKSSSYITN